MVRDPIALLRTNGVNRFTLHRLMAILENMACPVKWRVIWTQAELKRAARVRSPVLLYSFMSAHFHETAAEWRRLKAACPGARILAGGPHASARPEETLAAGADTVFVGEAESTLPKFWERHVRGGDAPWPRIVRSASPVDLDAVPVYARRADWFAPAEITRGCDHACAYCQTPTLFVGMRHRTVASLRPWLVLQRELKRPRFAALSPNALAFHARRPGEPNLDAIEELFVACREAGLSQIVFGAFPAEVRPEYVTEPAVKLMRRFCSNRLVAVGAQAATARLLRRCRRGHDTECVDAAVSRLQAAGFTPQVDYICGLPGETDADRRALVAQIERLVARRARVLLHRFAPLPGSAWSEEKTTPLDRGFRERLRPLLHSGLARGDCHLSDGIDERFPMMRAVSYEGQRPASSTQNVIASRP